ncbi:hypothetical protein V5799_020357 [Amblyomma americanum]|uniref:Uncharacterized protein n=1 Tax=Amblyomma americanum TaxID=6943 RepID=A0AAQ4EUE0_AMBAM
MSGKVSSAGQAVPVQSNDRVPCSSCRSFTGPALGGVLLQHIGYEWGTLVLFSFQAVVAALLVTAYIHEMCSRGKGVRSPPHRRLLEEDHGRLAANSTSGEFTTISGRVEHQQHYGACNGNRRI